MLRTQDVQVKDISRLKGMPLSKLYLDSCRSLTSLNGIQGLPLTDLVVEGCDRITQNEILSLKNIPTLTHLRTGRGERIDKDILDACQKAAGK